MRIANALAGQAEDAPVPDPAANRDGDVLHMLCGKPAAVVNKLRGRHELQPTAAMVDVLLESSDALRLLLLLVFPALTLGTVSWFFS